MFVDRRYTWQARRLQELFRGRFTNDEAQQLLINNGGLSEAVDFVLKGETWSIAACESQRQATRV